MNKKEKFRGLSGEEKFAMIIKHLNNKKNGGKYYGKKKKTYIVPIYLRDIFVHICKKNNQTEEETITMLIDNHYNNPHLQDLDFSLKEQEIIFKLSTKYLQKDLSYYKEKNSGIHILKDVAKDIDKVKKEKKFKFNGTIMLFLICMYIRNNEDVLE